MKNKINLPRKYKVGKDTPKKFHKYKGINKLSYSQHSSWNDPQYKPDLILGYFFGIWGESNAFAEFGSQVGTYIEPLGDMEYSMLSKEDIEILDEWVEKFSKLTNAEYEREIVLELNVDGEPVVVQGFIDLKYEGVKKEKDTLHVVDFKTLNIKKKKKFYESETYGQTTLYCKALINEGEKISKSGVIGFDRTFAGTFEDPILHLSGEVELIPTPYSEERWGRLEKKLIKTVKEMSSFKDTFDKLKELTIEV